MPINGSNGVHGNSKIPSTISILANQATTQRRGCYSRYTTPLVHHSSRYTATLVTTSFLLFIVICYTNCFLEPLKNNWTMAICKPAIPTINNTSSTEK